MSRCRDFADLAAAYKGDAQLSHRSLIVNGDMSVCQKSTSATGLGAANACHTIDCWNMSQSSAGRFTMSQDAVTDLSGFFYALKLACTTADTLIASGELFNLSQLIEGQNLQTLQKGTSSAVPVTASFYVKGNASATYTVELEDRDNTRYNSQEFPVTTDWVRVSRTFIADTTGTLDDDNAESLRLNFWL